MADDDRQVLVLRQIHVETLLDALEHHETVEAMCSHCDPSRRRKGSP